MNTRKIFASFILTYILIVIFTLLCLIPIFFSAVNSSKSLASQTLISYAKQSCSEYDLAKDHLFQSARRFYTDDTISNIYYKSLSLTDTEIFYQMTQMQKTLKLHFLNEEYLTDVIVYIPKYDYVLTMNNIFRSQQEFYSYIKLSQYSDDWLSQNWSYANTQYRMTLFTNLLNGEREVSCLSQILSFPMVGDSNIPMTMLLCMNSETIAKSFLMPDMAENSYVVVQDTGGADVMKYIPDEVYENYLHNPDYFTEITVTGAGQETIILGIDTAYFRRVLKEALKPIGVSILGALVLCAVFSFIFSKRHLRPIKNSIDAIREYQPEELSLQDSLEENISNMVKELQKSYSDIAQLKKKIRKGLLERAFFGGIESSGLKESFGTMYGDMPAEAVVVAIGPAEHAREVDVPSFFDTQLLPRLREAGIDSYIGLLHGQQYFLVTSYRENLVENLSNLLKNQYNETQFEAKAGLSNVISGLSSIEYGLRQARRRLESGISYEGIYVFQHTLKSANAGGFVTVSQLNVLHHMLLIGQTDSADNLICSLFESFSSSQWNGTELRQLFFSLRSVYSALISYFKEQAEKHMLEKTEWPVLPDDLEDNSPDRLKRFCLSLNHTLQMYYNQNLKRIKRDKGEEVILYVSQHFQDMNLCAGSIAEQFGLSEKYIYQLVKDASGKTLNQLITEIRIKEAIYLLENTKKTIADIAVESGFSSSNSMYKVFMRTQGVSPSSYREKKGV